VGSFSYNDFRQVEGCRVAVREFLTSDVGRLLLRVLRQKYTPIDVPSTADALASARVLAQLYGAHVALDDLENASVAPGQELAIESTFEAPETDHTRVPYELHEEFKPEIRVPPFVPPEPNNGQENTNG
jgi:hypothetical protein